MLVVSECGRHAAPATLADPRTQVRRIHRSTIVNLARIRERRRGDVLVLRSGHAVRIPRAFADRVSQVSASGSTRQKSGVSCNTIDSASFIG